MKEIIKGKKKFIGVAVSVALVILVVSLCIIDRRHDQMAEETINYIAELSEEDKELAGIYATLYELSDNEVAKMKQEKKDWDTVNKELEKQFFTIPEQKKYDMVQEGYDIEDLYEAEVMATKTGRKAIELAKEKGKAGEKKWSEVVKDEEVSGN